VAIFLQMNVDFLATTLATE